tara:strand:- start:63 stop:536 length:474 start_codon:yes stop_codon:yes gene_type:complete
MFRKIILLIISFNFLSQCGFSPTYSIQNGAIKNVSINEIFLTGDKTINNFIEINLKRNRGSVDNKVFNLKIDTQFYKETVTKDKTAKITDYKLSSVSNVEIILNGKLVKRVAISEGKDMNNMNDKFEEQKYERNIKQNFASSITNKIIRELSLINDN